MKRQTKAIIAAITLFMMLPFTILPASANSALTEWEGRKENNIMTTDTNSPIIVEHETITFDIQDLIDTEYGQIDTSKKYTSQVTAEYHFYNPSDMSVTAQLAFPIGTLQSNYANYSADKYAVTVNGKPIKHEVRHTFTNYSSSFNLESDLPRLLSDYATHDFITLNTPVTKYVFDIELVNENTSGYPGVYFEIDPADYENTKIYCPGSYATKLENGKIRISRNNLGMTIYFIGELPKELPKFTVFKDVFQSDEDEILPSTSSISSVSGTIFRELAFAAYKEEYGISEMDWYNAVMVGANYGVVIDGGFLSLEPRDFLCWYTYELTFEPGEKMVNSVCAPMIPGQNITFNPNLFKYVYLLSPATTWADFGTLDIYINTPYYLKYCSLDGFDKTSTGYELHLDGLPMTKKRLDFSWNEIKIVDPEPIELRFSLCAEENPEKTKRGSTTPVILNIIVIIVAIIFSPIILVVWIVNLTVQAVKRSINKT